MQEPCSDAPTEQGPWHYRHDPKAAEPLHRHFIESDDFTHDVRLYINGDFADDTQRNAYGAMLAVRLNAEQAANGADRQV